MDSRFIEQQGERYKLRRATHEEVIDLRHRVLRAGLPRESAIFDGDTFPNTVHVIASKNNQIVACATFLLNTYENRPAWQLRGMAVDETVRGTGIGAALLQFGIQMLLEISPVCEFWCNAREPAVKFYERQGWKIVSDRFEVPTADPHFRMHYLQTQQPL